MHKTILLGFLILLVACTQPSPLSQEVDQNIPIDLCDEITIPRAEVRCSDPCDCAITITGDERVMYFVDAELNSLLDFRGLFLQAGESGKLGYCKDSYVFIEVTPAVVEEIGSMGGNPCEDKRFRIAATEFR